MNHDDDRDGIGCLTVLIWVVVPCLLLFLLGLWFEADVFVQSARLVVGLLHLFDR